MFFAELQTKAALEKAKQGLEAENADLAVELKTVSSTRQECERRRKQAESSLGNAETFIRVMRS